MYINEKNVGTIINFSTNAGDPVFRDYGKQSTIVQLEDTNGLKQLADQDREENGLSRYEEDGDGFYSFSVTIVAFNGKPVIKDNQIRYETENFDEESEGMIMLDKDEAELVLTQLQKDCVSEYGESLLYGEPVPIDEETYIQSLVGLPGVGKSIRIRKESDPYGVSLRMEGDHDTFGDVLLEEHDKNVRAVLWDYVHDEPVMKINLC